jgi:phosphatidylinositol alpha-mannosyltransferase
VKIGIVCPYDLGAPGGVQMQCLGLAERLRNSGDEVTLVGPGQGNAWTSAGRVVAVTANGSRVPLTLAPTALRTVRSTLREVDVVHVHEPFIPVAGWAGLRAGKPTVATFHADPSKSVRTLYRVAARIGGRLLRTVQITAVSTIAADTVPPDWGPVEIIPNGVDVASFSGDGDRKPKRVLFLGRDDPRKGLDVVLDIWPEIHALHPDAELVVVGADRREGPASVIFTGRVTEEAKRSWLTSAEIYVAPNLAGESFGIVVADAMAAGCAVVASDIAAFRQVAPRAVFADPGDRRAWKQALTELLSDPSRIRTMGDQARLDVLPFDWSRVLGQYRSAYERAIVGPN